MKSSEGSKVVVVEDHAMFREVVAKLCAAELGLRVAAEVADGRAAIMALRTHRPDLVVLDLQLPDLDGFAVVEAVADELPRTAVLIVSSHCDDYTVYRAEQLHVRGFVDKNSNSLDALRQAVRAVRQGHSWFSETYTRLKEARQKNPNAFDKMLSRREQDVLALLCVPLTDAEVADRLGVSAETVAKHRFNLMRKLSVENTTALIRYAREHGFGLPGGAGGGPQSRS